MSKVKSAAFFGFSWLPKTDPEWHDVYNFAKRLAEKDIEIIDGGGPGVMLAATEGAESVKDSRTTGVYYRPKDSTMFEGEALANVADKKMYYADYVHRTLKLLELGDIYIIFNGGTGTISEFGMAWGLARLYYGHHKPLILFGDFWHEVLDSVIKNMHIREEEKKVFHIVSNVDEAITVFDQLSQEISERSSFEATAEEAKFMI